jgi:hypothetical protein
MDELNFLAEKVAVQRSVLARIYSTGGLSLRVSNSPFTSLSHSPNLSDIFALLYISIVSP